MFMKAYPNIDYLKFVLSLLVIVIHISKVMDTNVCHALDYMMRTAVPFFIIVTGYLMSDIILSGNLGKIKFSLKKYTYLYFTWMLIYFPFAIAYYLINNYDFIPAAKNYIYGLLIAGEMPMAWQMWYIHSMAVTMIVLLLFTHLKINLKIIIVLSLLITASASAISKGFNLDCNSQNFIITCLPCVCLGLILKQFQTSHSLLHFMFITIISVILYIYGISLFAMLGAYCLVGLGIFTSQINIGIDSMFIRELSKYIYFIHIIPTFLFRGLLDNILLYWIIVASITIICSIFIIQLKLKFNLKLI